MTAISFGWRSAQTLLLCALLLPGTSWAHARFVTASPAPNSSVVSAPNQVVLAFNEPVQPVSLKVIDASGHDLAADSDAVSIDNDIVLKFATPATTGKYVVSYRVLSGDAHPIAASFSFTVAGAAGSKAPPTAATPLATAESDWSRVVIIARAIYMLTLLLCMGGGLFLLLVPSATAIQAELRTGVTRLASLALLAALFYLQASGAAMLGSTSLPDIAALKVAATSSLGTSLGLAAIGLMMIIAARARHAALLIASIVLLAGSRALTGHPASRDPGWLLIPAMALHVACAAYWYGSLRPLYMSLKRLPVADAAKVLREFSSAAMIAVATLACAGLLMALVHLATPSALLGTWYGQLLIMKTTWFSVLLGLAAWHKLRLSPRIEAGDRRALRTLRISIVIEAIIMTLVLLISVNVASTAPEDPPRNATAETASTAAITAVETPSLTGAYILTLQTENALASVWQLTVRDLGGNVIEPLDISVKVGIPVAGIEAMPAVVKVADEGRFSVEPPITLPGTWEIKVDALITDFDKESFSLQLTRK